MNWQTIHWEKNGSANAEACVVMAVLAGCRDSKTEALSKLEKLGRTRLQNVVFDVFSLWVARKSERHFGLAW